MKVRYRQTFYALSLLIADIFVILAALKLSFWIKFESNLLPAPLGTPVYQSYAQAFGITVILMIVFFRNSNLYQEDKIAIWGEEVSGILKSSAFTFLILLSISFFYRGFSFSRGYIITAVIVMPICVIWARLVMSLIYIAYRRINKKYKEVLIVGANNASMKYAIHLLREARLCAKVSGFLDNGFPEKTHFKQQPILGKVQELDKVLESNPHINEVVVACTEFKQEDIMPMMLICSKHLVSFKWSPDILGFMTTQMHMRYEMGLPLLQTKDSPLANWENRLIKRIMDIALSFLGLVILSPLLILLAMLVKWDSKGPALYRQERVGEDGKTFDVLKFRTMKVGAEDKTGPVWAKKDDDRRTRMGEYFRKFNLDELPQLWNILVGDMSLVGPRPERPHFVGQFREDIPHYMGRHQIKSGLTGWAQVHGLRGDTSIQERTQYDLYYIENWSISLDIQILFKTLFAFKNAY